MLGGVTRMTISITVLAMEGTGALQLIVPLMLAALLAKVGPAAPAHPIPLILAVLLPKARPRPPLTTCGSLCRSCSLRCGPRSFAAAGGLLALRLHVRPGPLAAAVPASAQWPASAVLLARRTRCLRHQVVGDALSPGVYDVQIKTRSAPVLARTRLPAHLSMFCSTRYQRMQGSGHCL